MSWRKEQEETLYLTSHLRNQIKDQLASNGSLTSRIGAGNVPGMLSNGS
jgi:hypothetical protein